MDTLTALLGPLTTLVQALMPVIVPILIAWLGQQSYEWYQQQPIPRQQLVADLAQTAVYAAEQWGKTSTGAAKKDTAMRSLADSLATIGITMHPAELSKIIEATVYQRLNALHAVATKPVVPPPRG